MRSDKFKAYKLRAAGRSYNEIRKLLGVPKSTLSGWFTGLVLSDEATARIKKRVYEGSVNALIKRNKLQTHDAEKRAHETRKNSALDVKNLSQRELLLIGAALYWAEGYKRPIIKNGKARTYHTVSLSNFDPKLISIFLRFLREVCFVPEHKIKANIRIFEYQNEAYLLDFWQKVCKIPYSSFGKVYKGVSISSQRKRPFNILPYGTIQVVVNDSSLYHKIMGWIDGLHPSL